jgi:hypothetical protein
MPSQRHDAAAARGSPDASYEMDEEEPHPKRARREGKVRNRFPSQLLSVLPLTRVI